MLRLPVYILTKKLCQRIKGNRKVRNGYEITFKISRCVRNDSKQLEFCCYLLLKIEYLDKIP